MSVFTDLKTEAADKLLELRGENSLVPPDQEEEVTPLLRRLLVGWVRYPDEQFQSFNTLLQDDVEGVLDLTGKEPQVTDLKTIEIKLYQEQESKRPRQVLMPGLTELATLVP